MGVCPVAWEEGEELELMPGWVAEVCPVAWEDGMEEMGVD